MNSVVCCYKFTLPNKKTPYGNFTTLKVSKISPTKPQAASEFKMRLILVFAEFKLALLCKILNFNCGYESSHFIFGSFSL